MIVPPGSANVVSLSVLMSNSTKGRLEVLRKDRTSEDWPQLMERHSNARPQQVRNNLFIKEIYSDVMYDGSSVMNITIVIRSGQVEDYCGLNFLRNVLR